MSPRELHLFRQLHFTTLLQLIPLVQLTFYQFKKLIMF